jgi:protein phosphatase
MAAAHRLAEMDPAMLLATQYRRIDLEAPAQAADATAW